MDGPDASKVFEFQDSLSNKIVTRSFLDFESNATFSFTATITDDAGLSATMQVGVIVKDANDRPTVPETQTLTVAENFLGPAGTFSASDQDCCYSEIDPAWGVLSFTLDDDSNLVFETLTETSETTSPGVTVKTTFDYEDAASHSIIVTVTDGGGYFSSGELIVDVANANDAPEFASISCPFIAYVDATNAALGDYITTVPAFDEDSSNNLADDAWATLTYTMDYISYTRADGTVLVPGDASWTANDYEDYIVIDESTADLTLTQVSAVVLEDGATYTLFVTATDGGGLNASCEVYVSISSANRPPTITSAPAYAILEDASPGLMVNIEGTTVLTAEDCSSNVQSITWSISSCTILGSDASCGTPRASMFRLLSPTLVSTTDASCSTYTVELHYNTSTFTLNYEDTKFSDLAYRGAAHAFLLGITAEDDDDETPLATSAVVQVNVTDVNEPPTLASATWSIAEDADIGAFIGNLDALADDPDYADTAGTFTFKLRNVSASNIRKAIASDSFEVVGNETLVAGQLDYENCSYFSLTVEVEDQLGLKGTSNIGVSVTDVNEPPKIKTGQVLYVDEDAAVGSVIGTVLATDPDFGVGALTYTLMTDSLNSTFELSSSTGELTLLSEPLDFETRKRYAFHVTVEDQNGLSDQATVRIEVVDVNDLVVNTLTVATADGKLDTLGGDTVTFVGENFGWAPDANDYDDDSKNTTVLVSATYENSFDSKTYAAEACEVVVANTVINCTAAPGVGYGHLWTLTVDATAGGAASAWGIKVGSGCSDCSAYESSYKPPVLSTVGGASAMRTRGGDTATLTGSNFGPASLTNVITVTYGRSASTVDEFECVSPVVVEDSTLIECVTTAGIGAQLHWQVAVGLAFDSTLFSSPFKESDSGYVPPSIGNVTGPLLDTGGDELVTLFGDNFGPISLSTNVSAAYGGHGFRKYSAEDCAVIADHTVIECTSVPGVGANLSWSVVVGGQRSDGSSNGTVSYKPPVIAPKSTLTGATALTGTGASDADTRGNQKLIVAGTQFGPGDEPNAPVLVYGREGQYVAVSCEVSVEHSQITCLTADGVGRNHPILLSVGDQWSNIYDANMSYASPVVSGYDAEWLKKIQDDDGSNAGAVTQGGEWVIVDGTGFGTVAMNAISKVTYGPTGYEFVPCENGADDEACLCHVIEDHYQINCTMVEGVGGGLSFVVIIDGQESVSPTIGYDRPDITGFTLEGAFDARVAGGQRVNISGTNFGPADAVGATGNKTAYLEAVTYGPSSGDEYAAEDCSVSSHESIICRTAPGIGGTALPMHWLVTVKGQRSDLSIATTNYAPPNVTGVSKTDVSTRGGSVVEINGTDLGLSVVDAYLEVQLDGVAIPIDGVSTTKIWKSGSVDYAWTDADGIDHVQFVVPEMTDADQAKWLRVFIDTPSVDDVSAYSAPVPFRYGSPVITDIQNVEGKNEHQSEIYIIGKNFGDGFGGSVLIDNVPQEHNAWDHELIFLTCNDTSGNITIVVGDEVSDRVVFSDYSPIIYPECTRVLTEKMTGYYMEDGYSTEGEDEEGRAGRLYVAARYLYDDITDIRVTIGGGNGAMDETECVVDNNTLVELCDGNSEAGSCHGVDGACAASLCGDNGDACPTAVVKYVSCLIPPGTGETNPVTLYRTKRSSYSVNGTDVVTLDYWGPTILSIEPTQVGTTGGTITITGTNFGAYKSRTVVTSGGEVLVVDPSSYTHTSMEVYVPAGAGVARRLELSIDGQSTILLPTMAAAIQEDVLPFAYSPPTITHVNITEVPTTGATSLMIYGENFGTCNSDRMMWLASRGALGAGSAANAFEALSASGDSAAFAVEEISADCSGHAWLELHIGPGQGLTALVMNVSGNIGSAPLNFTAPFIAETSPSPLHSPTLGGIGMFLRGSNFGVGEDFEVVISSFGSTDGSGVEYVATQDGSGSFAVTNYTHGRIEFASPAGQTEGSLSLELRVAGQSSNRVPFNYSSPSITMVAEYSSIELGENGAVETAFPLEAGAETMGRTSVAIVGENFGISQQRVFFDGVWYGTDDTTDDDIEARFEVETHELIHFIVPQGVGVNKTLQVQVGSKISNPVLISYAPPSVLYVSPTRPTFPSQDTFEFHGSNFGYADYDKTNDFEDASVRIGDIPCVGIRLTDDDVAIEESIWRKDDSGKPYLWCQIPAKYLGPNNLETSAMTVGPKNITITVAEQTIAYSVNDELIVGMCDDNYYGRAGWDVYSLPGGSDVPYGCYAECTPAQEWCMTRWDGTTYNDNFAADGNNADDKIDCWEQEPCARYESQVSALAYANETRNCTVLARRSEYCLPCPIGSTCEPQSSLYTVEPVAEYGYWRLSLDGFPNSPENCPIGRKHRSTCWDFSPCDPPSACLGDNTCDIGYTGSRCATCCDAAQKSLGNEDCLNDNGESILYYRINGSCKKCDDNPWVLVAMAALCLVVLGSVGYLLNKKKVSLAILAIGVDYFQILSIFANTKAEWPELIVKIYDFFSMFSFDINITAPECTFSITYRRKWIIVMLFPLVMLLCAVIFHVSYTMYKRFKKHKRGAKASMHRHKLISMSLLGFYYLYLYLASTAIDPFNCSEIVSEDGVSDGKMYMVSDASMVCWEQGTTQQELLPFSIIATLLYSIGYPMMLGSILFRSSNLDKFKEDQLLRAQGTGFTRKTNPHCYNIRKRYGEMYYRYKPECWYWTLVILLRKFCIVMVSISFNKDPTFQMCIILLVCFGGYAAQVRYSPYMSIQERKAALIKYYEDTETINHAIAEHNQVQHIPRKKPTTGSDPRKQLSIGSIKCSREAAGALLFNYNIVESTLQFSAILVCTFGIMFEAEYLNGAQKGALEMSTCLVIFGSMIYYFIVAWCEVVGGLVPQLRCAFLSGQVNADEENEDDDDEPDDAEFEMFENQMTKNDSENPMKRDTGPKLLSVGEQVKLQQDVAQAVDKKRGLQKQLKALNTQQLQRGAKVCRRSQRTKEHRSRSRVNSRWCYWHRSRRQKRKILAASTPASRAASVATPMLTCVPPTHTTAWWYDLPLLLTLVSVCLLPDEYRGLRRKDGR